MAVKDRNVEKNANVALECLTFDLGTTATGQTALLTDAAIPGYDFRVEKVEVFATAVTAAITVNVLIGTTSVLASAITPVANTVVAGTLATAYTARAGTATGELRVRYTSDGTGAATRCKVRVWIRPRPLAYEAV